MAPKQAGVSEAYFRRLVKAHEELGIPDSYRETTLLPIYEEPDELVDIGPDCLQRPQRLTPAAALAWSCMEQAAAQQGTTLLLVSAYRGLEYQSEVIRKKLAAGRELIEILKVNAAPGFSEHHTGRAIDLGTPDCALLEEDFETTPAFHWLTENAGDFGFVMSFPRDNPFGISYEPWHWCFRS